MKKLMLVIALEAMVFICFGQKIKTADVPATAKSTFGKQYPKATEVKWNKENGNFEASFDLDKVDNSVLIDPSGKVLETEVEIEINQLSKIIVEYIKTNYKGASIKEAAKITDAKGSITYEAELKGKDLIFDSKGKFIKETKD
jgi:hypothetical protein